MRFQKTWTGVGLLIAGSTMQFIEPLKDMGTMIVKFGALPMIGVGVPHKVFKYKKKEKDNGNSNKKS